jgi:hypothetical protein
MNREQQVRDVLGLDETVRVLEIAWFPASDRTRFMEESLSELEANGESGDWPAGQALADETLGVISAAEATSPDPDLEEVFPAARVRRSEVDTRILVLEGVPDSAVAEGPVEQTGPGTWMIDTRGEYPAIIYVGHRKSGVAMWASNGEIRVFSVEA